MQNNVLSIVESYVKGEGDVPPGLREFVVQSHEAARLARQYGGDWQGRGGRQLRERIMHVADWAATLKEGDIAHVGHGNGNVTAALAAVAQKHGCRVVAVNTGASDEERQAFDETMLPYRDNKHVFRRLDKDSRLGEILKGEHHWRFALISDKDNDFRSYLDDVMIFTSCPVVAVDYCFHPNGPRLAFEVAAVLQGRVMVRDARCREGYLVRP
jgi:hypothetical protein